MWSKKINRSILLLTLAGTILGGLGCADAVDQQDYASRTKRQTVEPEEIQIEVVLKEDRKNEVKSASEAPAVSETPMYQNVASPKPAMNMMPGCDQRRPATCQVTTGPTYTQPYAGAGYAGAGYAGAGYAGAPLGAGIGAGIGGPLGAGIGAGVVGGGIGAPFGGIGGPIGPGLPIDGPFFGPGIPFVVEDILLEDDNDHRHRKGCRRDHDHDDEDDDEDDNDGDGPTRSRWRNR